MNAKYIISQLESNIQLFNDYFNNIPDELIYWRSQPAKWNLLEIICHLYDEEREDFRARLKLVLENPSQTFPSIDPVNWVAERNYSTKDIKIVHKDFILERNESIRWLRSLIDLPFDNAFQHPKFGLLSGKLFLSNWLAHDYLHFRQITKIKYDYLSFVSGQNLDYAGSW